jgi:hypothetical protein
VTRGGATALLLLAGCGGSPPMEPPPDLSAAADLSMIPQGSGIGNACARAADPDCADHFDLPGAQGSCASDQICILPTCQFVKGRALSFWQYKGGYCTADCAGANGHPDSSLCPDDALCSSTDRAETQQCVRACTRDQDCRAGEGYTCQIDGLGAYADQHLPTPRGQTHSCRLDTACARTGDEPDAGFLNQPVPLAPNILAASEGNVAFDGKDRVVVTYIGYWVQNGVIDNGIVALGCSLDANRNCTWTAPTTHLWAHGGVGHATDPSVAFDPVTGDFYWAWLDYAGGSASFVRVSRSTDGGRSWSAPVDAAGGIADKPWIVARGGTVWALSVDAPPALRISRSTDQGQTWSQHRLVVASEIAFYPQAAVDPAGNLLLAWLSNQTGVAPDTAQVHLRVAEWPAGVNCATLPAREDCLVGKVAVATSTTYAADKIDDVPYTAALNPADGSYWLAWIRGDRYTGSDVVAARCALANQTFACGAPVRVSQPGAQGPCGARILPTLAFDEMGGAHAAWFDNRYGGGDRGRFWYAHSPDGTTWQEAVLSDAPAVFTTGKEWSSGWAGDYIGITAAGGRVIAAWSDSRDLPPTGVQPTGFVRQRLFLGVK